MPKSILLFCLLFILAPSSILQAQNGRDVWYFGTRASLKFTPGEPDPAPIAFSSMNTFEACASIADDDGNLLFYSDAESIWQKNHNLMPNGFPLGGNSSASQGALIVRGVGSTRDYYLFTLDSKENNLRNGFRYSLIDMRLENGLGAVTKRGVPIPLPEAVLPTEHLTAIPQDNGRDYWIIVHGFNNNKFYAFALTADGLSSTPVVSSVGPTFSAATTAQTGVLRGSPDGRRLAVTMLLGGVQLFDFNPSTGEVSNGLALITPSDGGTLKQSRCVGVEFSPDGSLLYTHEGASVLQFDVFSNSAETIRASRRELGILDENYVGDFLRGPNGKIYIAVFNAPGLRILENCNSIRNAYLVPGTNSLYLFARSQYGLPDYIANPILEPSVVQDEFQITGEPSCAGSPSLFSSYVRGTKRVLRNVTWTFSPDATVYTGSQIAPVFLQPGTRELQATAEFTDGSRMVQTRQVTIPPSATVRLRTETQTGTLLCGESGILLTAAASTEGTFSWADGATTQPTRRVSEPGTYRVTFKSAGGCTVTDSVVVSQPLTACDLPNIITPNGDNENQRFVMKAFQPSNWSVAIFNRWGKQVYYQVSYQNDWQADGQPAGIYYYMLRHKNTHEELKGWVEVVR
ncbi:gliding motility-associated C-terminal domain-containing protein [Hymenobacter tibetensis]|uniref:Gliding motility-associated C-terminal domain-containing protein n=1 Tax=Hymenobacter tibetensis TaxID=497967 RepID=A0ABY4D3M3_9BACT|nr:gliding motility-associated C-terminal domain-containing protein [Hymenobacter tibetensis]UOG76524.1 gliding motility-associated C-terminal domain-containing protein [Hymenobacter tibetensis]